MMLPTSVSRHATVCPKPCSFAQAEYRLALPAPGEPPAHRKRVYQPGHNIGHFRYLECSRHDEQGQAAGEITHWNQIQFPFDPRLQTGDDLALTPVQRIAENRGMLVCEEYTCDAFGNLRVKISTTPSGYEREFAIGQLAAEEPALVK